LDDNIAEKVLIAECNADLLYGLAFVENLWA